MKRKYKICPHFGNLLVGKGNRYSFCFLRNSVFWIESGKSSDYWESPDKCYFCLEQFTFG